LTLTQSLTLMSTLILIHKLHSIAGRRRSPYSRQGISLFQGR